MVLSPVKTLGRVRQILLKREIILAKANSLDIFPLASRKVNAQLAQSVEQ